MGDEEIGDVHAGHDENRRLQSKVAYAGQMSGYRGSAWRPNPREKYEALHNRGAIQDRAAINRPARIDEGRPGDRPDPGADDAQV